MAVAVAHARTLSMPFFDDDHDWLAGGLGDLRSWSPYGSFVPTERLAWSASTALLGAAPTPHRLAYAAGWVLVATTWAAVARRVGAAPLAAAALGALVVTHPALAWTYGWLSCWAYLTGALGLGVALVGALDVVDDRPSGAWALPLGTALAACSKEVFAVAALVPVALAVTRGGLRTPRGRAAIVASGLVVVAWAGVFAALNARGVWGAPPRTVVPLGRRLAGPTATVLGVPPWSWWALALIVPAAAVDRAARRVAGWAALGAGAHVAALALAGVQVPYPRGADALLPSCGVALDPVARYAFVVLLWATLALAGAVAAVGRRRPGLALPLSIALLASTALSAATSARCEVDVLGMAADRERARAAWADATLDALDASPSPAVEVPAPGPDAARWTLEGLAPILAHRASETGRAPTRVSVGWSPTSSVAAPRLVIRRTPT